jgi:hypothetical protein
LETGGNLILSNTIASAAKPLGELGMSDSTLTVHLRSATTNAYVTNLVCGGLQNLISIASVAGCLFVSRTNFRHLVPGHAGVAEHRDGQSAVGPVRVRRKQYGK